ncbi:MAG: hypothetical protein WCG42_00710 [Parachlamydiaceae bacterium]
MSLRTCFSSFCCSQRSAEDPPVDPPKITFDSLYHDAKYEERKKLHDAFKGAFDRFLEIHHLPDGFTILSRTPIDKENLRAQLIKKIERLFLVVYLDTNKCKVGEAVDKIKALNLDSLPFDDYRTVEQKIREHAEFLQLNTQSLIFQKYINELRSDLHFLHSEELAQKKEELRTITLLFGEITNELNEVLRDTHLPETEAYRESIDAIIKILRNMMNTNLYRVKRTDENDLLTNFIHTMCFAGYHDNLLSDNFESFGKNILSKIDIPRLSLGWKISKAWDKMFKDGLPCDNKGSLKHFKPKEKAKLAGEYTGYEFTGLTHRNGIEALDERKFPDNIPGSLYEEKCSVGSIQSCFIRAVYTCNPTVGIHVASEFKGVLQAMENRYFTPIDNDPYPYTFWRYTNLQDLSNTNENPHAVALMNLNDEYPLSFGGISVTQDSPFYVKDGVFNQDYSKRLLDQLLDDDNFTLESRLKKRQGGLYFFPEKQKSHWQLALPRIVEEAYRTIFDNKAETSNADLCKAFKELVHLGIMRHHQQLSAQSIQQLVEQLEFRFFDSRVCKSCIDRGGKNTISQLVVLSDPFENEDLILGAFHGRPLLVARRLMLEKYKGAFFSLLKALPHEILKDYVLSMGNSIEAISQLNFSSVRILRSSFSYDEANVSYV